MGATIYIGTSGYSYKDWKGVFYPEGVNPGDYLSFFAENFTFVELNFSYYRQPDRRMSQGFVHKTPADFLFSIKAHQSITHQREGSWKDAVDSFLSGIAPLEEEGRLAGVLLQFPYSFHRTKENRVYLAGICDALGEYPLFIEFRGKEWQSRAVYKELRERGIGLVNVDSPEIEGLPDPSEIATSERGYIRFHGRNKRNWWSGDNATRYDYLYSEEELSEWVSRIHEIISQVKTLFIAFNNHHKGQAVENAFQLIDLLRKKNGPGGFQIKIR